MTKETTKNNVGRAKASGRSLPISTKFAIEVCGFIRYKNLQEAKRILEGTVKGTTPIPFKKAVHDLGHKKGIGPGRFPRNAAREILVVLKSLEANAQSLGLDTSRLKITHAVASFASRPTHGGRHRGLFKRTHVFVEAEESAPKLKKEEKKKSSKESKKNEKKEKSTKEKPEVR